MARPTFQVDLRALPPASREAELLRALDALPAGGAFVLVSDRDPKPLLYELLKERVRHFDWNVLESSPERFRVEIGRRTKDEEATASDDHGGDHRRLDAILGEVQKLVLKGSFADAKERFKEFSCGLDRHIEIEEQFLFPAFERMTGITDGPTAVMRSEHEEIRRFLARSAAALDRQDASGLETSLGGLKYVLHEHNGKEERVLYPMTQDTATRGHTEPPARVS